MSDLQPGQKVRINPSFPDGYTPHPDEDAYVNNAIGYVVKDSGDDKIDRGLADGTRANGQLESYWWVDLRKEIPLSIIPDVEELTLINELKAQIGVPATAMPFFQDELTIINDEEEEE